MYINIESLYYTSETTIMLYASYTSIKPKPKQTEIIDTVMSNIFTKMPVRFDLISFSFLIDWGYVVKVFCLKVTWVRSPYTTSV